MTFEERKREATALLIEFLDTFTPPRGLDEKQQATRISQTADAFARRMPTRGEYDAAVRAVLTKVLDTHQSNTWPPQAAFVLAMPNREVREFLTQETFQPKDPVELTADLMREGESVPEPAIWGVMASQLPRADLDRYRNASVLKWMEVYGNDAAGLMRAKYGAVVDAFFPRKAAE